MPQVDVQWPSEDEDFDAKTDEGSKSQTAVKDRPSITEALDHDDAPVDEESDDKSENNDNNDDDKEESSEATEESEAPKEEDPEPASDQPEEAEKPEETEDPSTAEPEETPTAPEEDESDAPAAPVAAVVTDDQPPEPPQDSKSKKSMKLPKVGGGMGRIVFEAVLVIAVVGLGLYSWNLYSDRKDLESQVASLNANPQSLVQKQTDQLIAKVGKLMQLPSGTPTVAEVSDAAQAKQQSSFFDNAQNGDRVLMYVKSGEAILYRPSTNKIILVAPLVFSNTTSSSTNSSTTSDSSSK
jgi:hypothetical protein